MNTHNIFLWRNTDIYVYMLIYHQMPSLSVSLDQIQKISKTDNLFIYLKREAYGITYTF